MTYSDAYRAYREVFLRNVSITRQRDTTAEEKAELTDAIARMVAAKEAER